MNGSVSLSLTGSVFESYSSETWERFRALGVDLTAGHQMAEALAYHTSNKPLFGFAKHHREHDPAIQKELNIALVHHADEGNEKGVQLALWAGADPHAPALSLRFPIDVDEDDGSGEDGRYFGSTAIEEACSNGNLRILERLGPDPARDDFDKLFELAANRYVIERLVRVTLPTKVGEVIASQFFWMEQHFFGHPRSIDTLRPLFEAGARWSESSAKELAKVRRSLLRMSERNFVEAMKFLASNDYCSPTILRDLGRTPAMRALMSKVGFAPSSPDKHRVGQKRPTRSREVLAKFGVEVPEVPKVKPRLAHTVEIGRWRRGGRDIHLDRATLFEHVWVEPIEKLAKIWGLSGRGLSKACQRLQIPVPPRGYWARVQYGQKIPRPRFPQLQPGEAEEVVIHLPG